MTIKLFKPVWNPNISSIHFVIRIFHAHKIRMIGKRKFFSNKSKRKKNAINKKRKWILVFVNNTLDIENEHSKCIRSQWIAIYFCKEKKKKKKKQTTKIY